MEASSGAATLAHLYGYGSRAAGFAVEHIDVLKQSESLLANRCGEVLEQVVLGFGIGESAGLTLIGLGQALLGNPLTGAVAAAPAISPVVLTCAAFGAVHYGWKALSNRERQIIVGSVAGAFGVGIELVKSIADFALRTIRTVMTRENLEQFRSFVVENAALFGKRMSEITRAISDRVAEIASGAGAAAKQGMATLGAHIPWSAKP